MLSFFPRDAFGEILDLIESVSEGFPTYSFLILLVLFIHVFFIHYTKVRLQKLPSISLMSKGDQTWCLMNLFLMKLKLLSVTKKILLHVFFLFCFVSVKIR